MLTDVDGVLLNWIDAFENNMKKQGYESNPIFSGDMGIPIEKMFNIPRSEAIQKIYEFNRSEHMYNLDVMPGAVEAIKKIYTKYNRIHIITACGEEAKNARIYNLRNKFGDIFEAIHFVEIEKSKKKILLNYQNYKSYFIEDNYKHALDAKELGLRPIILKNNKVYDDMPSYRTWSGILNYLEIDKY